MNGWQRLWVVISIIWAVIVVFTAALMVKDTYKDPDGHWIIYRLSDKAKEFYKDLEKDEKGPMFTVTFKYTDGSEQKIRFPVLEKTVEELELGEKLKKLADENNKKISKLEIEKFLKNVSKNNKRAESAKKEYASKVETVRKNNIEERKSLIKISILFLILPPIIILILGYSFAWVRKGFRQNA